MSGINIQALMDGMSAQYQRDRATTQLTLGKLITRLESLPPNTPVSNLRHPHSYRGFYNDLAFELEDGTRPAITLLAECREAMGQVFQGYKGGDFVMGALTPLWVAPYGCCGDKLIALQDDGKAETRPDEE